MAINPKLEDVDYQIFWREVAEAARQVELNHGLSFVVERGAKSARVFYMPMKIESEAFVAINIFEVEPKQPTLLVP